MTQLEGCQYLHHWLNLWDIISMSDHIKYFHTFQNIVYKVDAHGILRASLWVKYEWYSISIHAGITGMCPQQRGVAIYYASPITSWWPSSLKDVFLHMEIATLGCICSKMTPNRYFEPHHASQRGGRDMKLLLDGHITSYKTVIQLPLQCSNYPTKWLTSVHKTETLPYGVVM